MAKRKVSNPLALAVLACLYEKPMHPYEMATTLRNRGKHESIKLNYGSLYSVVESLQRHEWIVPQETEREGRRPERTVYALTDTGREQYFDWLSELIAVPVKEYTQFEAGLSFMPSVSRDEALELLRNRAELLQEELDQAKYYGDAISDVAVPRLFLIETEYWLAMREAELNWVKSLIESIENGSILLSEAQVQRMSEFTKDMDADQIARMYEWVREWAVDGAVPELSEGIR